MKQSFEEILKGGNEISVFNRKINGKEMCGIYIKNQCGTSGTKDVAIYVTKDEMQRIKDMFMGFEI